MKNILWFILLLLLVLIGIISCIKDDPPLVYEEPASTSSDSTDNDKPRAAHGLPTLSLLMVDSVTCVTAHVTGEIIDFGDLGGTAANYGVCWSTTPNPTFYDNKTISIDWAAIHLGSYFHYNLGNLNSATTYYVRAYTIRSTDTAYSNQLSFTTNLSTKPAIIATILFPTIRCTTVEIAYAILDDGGNPVIKKGICWATTPNSTTEDNNIYYVPGLWRIGDVIYYDNGHLFYLEPGTRYYARPYFITSAGTFYGEDISFTTLPLPTVITVGVTNITATTAEVIGNVTYTSSSFVVSRGIFFDTVPNRDTVIMRGGFGLADHFIEQEVQSADGAGEFTVSMTNLTPGTCYYVSTFVLVFTGPTWGDCIIGYGNEISFTTRP